MPNPPPGRPGAAYLVAAAVAALCLLVSVSSRIDDYDLWQHLIVAKVIWSTHAIPRVNLWTWPTWHEPQVLPSWGFRALLWPVWALGGTAGLVAWRWLTTLAAFGLMWATARRMGARGFGTFVVIVLCGLVYRQRSQVRPETLAAVFLALEIWILETRRAMRLAPGPDEAPADRRGAGFGIDRGAWLVVVMWLWANVHISYPIGFVVLGIHALADLLPRRGAPRSLRLIWIGLAAFAASFLNPFGGRALWEPFEYFLSWRQERMFRIIAELKPVDWGMNLTNGLPLIVAGWPVLMLWRLRKSGADLVEFLMLGFLFWIALPAAHFMGVLALGAVPYLARDLDAWFGSRRWPAWTGVPARRATSVALICVAGSIPEWSRSIPPLGLSLVDAHVPVAACDFMAAHGIRGCGFNPAHFGGYLLWRFWPDSGRLPFMDTHATGTPEARGLAAAAFVSPEGYEELMGRYPFDYAMVDRVIRSQFPMIDFFDQDTTWAAVFMDDASALFVRRAGPLRAVADSFAYRVWPAGFSNLGGVMRRSVADSAYGARVDAELVRQIEGSPRNAIVHNFRANLALREFREDDAERELRAALAVDPQLPGAHERLGLIALRRGRAREALREFELQLRRDPEAASDLDLLMAQAWRQLGTLERARACYRRELRRNPGSQEARDSLAALERGSGP